MKTTEKDIVALRNAYEERIKLNIQNRIMKSATFADSMILQGAEREICKRDILYWFENYAYTQNVKGFYTIQSQEIPFLLFDYQKEFVLEVWDCIQRAGLPFDKRGGPTDVFIEKSRQLGITWLICGIFLYGFTFHSHEYLCISRTAEEVDKLGEMQSIFEKIRFMNRLQPKWMRAPGSDGENSKYMGISRSDGSGSISGKSASADAGRGSSKRAIFMDEMASMQYGTQINSACASATNCRIMNSTPKGKFNEFYRMREVAYAEYPAVVGLRYHWSEHPFYTDEWYEAQRATYKGREWACAQELDIDYTGSVEGAVYKMWNTVKIGKGKNFEYDYRLKTYVIVDNSQGGNDNHAIIVAQTWRDQIRIIDSLMLPPQTSVTECVSLLAKRPVNGWMMDEDAREFFERYKDYTIQTFIVDPYNADSKLNDTSIRREYEKYGIYVELPTVEKGDYGNIPEQIRITANNLDRLFVNELHCQMFYDIIAMAHYPERGESSQAVKGSYIPVHDVTSHWRTALEYFMLYLTEHERKEVPESTQQFREEFNTITGEVYRVPVGVF